MIILLECTHLFLTNLVVTPCTRIARGDVWALAHHRFDMQKERIVTVTSDPTFNL